MQLIFTDPTGTGRYETQVATTNPAEEKALAGKSITSGDLGLIVLSIAQGLLAEAVKEHRSCAVAAIAKPTLAEITSLNVKNRLNGR